MSTADIEDLLAARGVIVSREAVRLWVNRFGQHFADCIRQDRPRPNDKWHLDEVVITIRGKIERWHQTLKNRILLEHYFLLGDLEAQIEAFVDHYHHQRYHESLNNVTPSDVYFGRDKAILKQRGRIKRKTLEARRLHHRQRAA